MTNPYESDQLLAEYLLFHYGADDEILGKLPGPREALSFPRRSVSELIGPMQRDARALDVGCAVGRATFELARYAASVTGIDFSARFIWPNPSPRRFPPASIAPASPSKPATP